MSIVVLSFIALNCSTESELIFMDLPNQPTIVLNSTKSILALMEGHAKLYSSKAVAVMDDMYVALQAPKR